MEGKPLLVRDSDKLYDLFDLISATDEFFATGPHGAAVRLPARFRRQLPQDGYPAEQHREILGGSAALQAARLLDDISARKLP